MTLVRTRALALTASLFVPFFFGCAGSPPPAARADQAEPAAALRSEPRGPELTAAEVVHHLRGNETELRRCFFENPSLRGAATFSWRLDVTGKVHGVRREASTLRDPRVEACLSQRLSEIRFGDLSEPARARWTFVFRLVDPADKAQSGKRSKKSKQRAASDERGVVIDPRSEGVLGPDAIDNVVEAGYPLFARCYRDGIGRDNELDGTVRLRFVVGSAGAVSQVSDSGSDLTDRQVVDCIAEGFYALRFPQPAHGSVQVLYRIGFQAG